MTPSQAAEGVVSEERLEHLAVMHFNIDFLPDRQEFIDIQIALRELQHLRRLSTQNAEGWRPIRTDRDPPEGGSDTNVLAWLDSHQEWFQRSAKVVREYPETWRYWLPWPEIPPTLASRDGP